MHSGIRAVALLISTEQLLMPWIVVVVSIVVTGIWCHGVYLDKWRILLEANHEFLLRKCSMTRRMICSEFINIKPSCHISSKLAFRQICGVNNWFICFRQQFCYGKDKIIDVHSLLDHSFSVRRKHGWILNHGKRVAGYHMTLSEKVRKGDSKMMPTAFPRARRSEYSEKNHQAY